MSSPVTPTTLRPPLLESAPMTLDKDVITVISGGVKYTISAKNPVTQAKMKDIFEAFKKQWALNPEGTLKGIQRSVEGSSKESVSGEKSKFPDNPYMYKCMYNSKGEIEFLRKRRNDEDEEAAWKTKNLDKKTESVAKRKLPPAPPKRPAPKRPAPKRPATTESRPEPLDKAAPQETVSKKEAPKTKEASLNEEADLRASARTSARDRAARGPTIEVLSEEEVAALEKQEKQEKQANESVKKATDLINAWMTSERNSALSTLADLRAPSASEEFETLFTKIQGEVQSFKKAFTEASQQVLHSASPDVRTGYEEAKLRFVNYLRELENLARPISSPQGVK